MPTRASSPRGPSPTIFGSAGLSAKSAAIKTALLTKHFMLRASLRPTDRFKRAFKCEPVLIHHLGCLSVCSGGSVSACERGWASACVVNTHFAT